MGMGAEDVFASNKPPSYLKIKNKQKTTALDRRMKERMMEFPSNKPRRPAEVMDVELKQMREELTQIAKEKKIQTRQDRRLQRRCRVKPGEDLAALEEKYGCIVVGSTSNDGGCDGGRFLQPLQNPEDREYRRVAASKDFFVGLGRLRL